jgi:small subunit ribosomal protein S20
MAITDSAKKALRQSLRRRGENRDRKNNLKKLLKDLKALVAQKKIEEAKKLLPQVFKYLDKAAKTGIIKKNTASRKKSAFSRLVSKQK